MDINLSVHVRTIQYKGEPFSLLHRVDNNELVPIVKACKGVRELESAFLRPITSYEALQADLKSALQLYLDRKGSHKTYLQEQDSDEANINFVDRKFYNNNKPRYPAKIPTGRSLPFRKPWTRLQSSNSHEKREFKPHKYIKEGSGCWVYSKKDCISYNHTEEERARVKRQFFAYVDEQDEEEPDDEIYLQIVNSCEGSHEQEEERGEQAAAHLTSVAFYHRATGEDIYSQTEPENTAEQFTLIDHYTTAYQGELWDTGAARFSTVGKCQAEAFLRENPRAKVD
ncbi:hypothetical protein Vi05172_g5623 [Venturia inaequalis]|nr:hypothetical protein Vi05172_g5623 [Venturia inaequalis]